MSAQLADLRQATPAPGPVPPVQAPPLSRPRIGSRRASARGAPREAPAAKDVDRGIGLLFRFSGGAAVIVADVIVVSAIDRSWILAPAFAVLLLTTFVVFAGIMRLLADGAEGHP